MGGVSVQTTVVCCKLDKQEHFSPIEFSALYSMQQLSTAFFCQLPSMLGFKEQQDWPVLQCC